MRRTAFCKAHSSVVRLFALVLGLGTAVILSGCGGGSNSGGSGGSSGSGGGSTTPTPSITSISPTQVTAGASATILTVTGTGFQSTSVVEVDSVAESTAYVSSTQLTASVPAGQLAAGAELPVAVLNGSLISTSVNLEVDNPAPTIASVSPTSELTGTTAATIAVVGTGFVPATVINVNGAAGTTTYVSSTQVNAALSLADVTAAGSLSLTAVNPTPGGGTSTAATVAVVAPNPVPSIAALNPSSLVAGAASIAITVTGTNFLSSTVIDVNGSPRATTFTSATQVSVTLTAADVASAGSLSLAAVNPAPGGGGSAAVALPIYNPTVGLITLYPSVLTVGMTSPTTVTVAGSTFVPTSVVQVNGSARPTTFVNLTDLTFTATVADQATAGQLAITVTNPAPGGGTSPIAYLPVSAPAATPVITSVTPNSIVAGSGDTSITVMGTGFTTNSVVQWNGTPLPTSFIYNGVTTELFATVPAAFLITTGTASATVNTPNANPPLSNAVTVNITNPPAPTVTEIGPSSGPINTAAAINVYGTGFTSNSTVALNGETIASTYVNSTEITATIPAAGLAFPGNVNITVTTPAPGGGTSAPGIFTVCIPITASDIVFNATDGLLYASEPATSPGVSGNSVVGIDPTTGNITRQIQVGSNPNKLALSSDGTQLFVGLDGAASVAQVNLTQGQVVNQFSLGGGEGIYNPPLTALYLAAVPGLPNSVAVATEAGLGSGTGITIYDSGVARADAWSSGEGPLSFGSSAATLYVLSGSTLEQLTLGTTGITAAAALASLTQQATWLQYDNGDLYLSSGQVLNAANGSLLGTFYSSTSTAASGPIVSDSTLGRAFVALPSYSNSGAVLAFNESSFNLLGSIVVNGAGENGYGVTFERVVRWGQNGIALNASPGPFTSQSQLFIFQSSLVQDLSSSPADLSVTLNAPSAAATGTSATWTVTVQNLGPNTATGAAVSITLDPSLVMGTVSLVIGPQNIADQTPNQGSCGTGTTFSCDLGDLGSGNTATITLNATPTQAGTLESSAAVSSVSYDPTTTNDQATGSTTVTGSTYGAVPVLSAISPNLVEAGSGEFTLTVSGTGFNADSTVNLGSTALSTTFVSATQLTATVTATGIANYGWAPVTVSNQSPGGGLSQVLPLTIYALVNVPASALLFDPYAQWLYATIPSTSTSVTGNSVVQINPVTGAAGTPVAVGSQPTVMAETTDGDYLYIALTGSNNLAQFNLLNQSLTATIPVFLTQYGSTTSTTPTSLAAMPGTDSTLAVGLTNGWGQFGILDVSGATGTLRPNLSGIYEGQNPVFASASELYAYDDQTSGAEFYRYSVNASGLTEIDGTTLNGMGGFGGGFQLANGLVYGTGGGVINPTTTPPSQVAVLPRIDFYGSGSTSEGVGLAADPSLGKEFLMLENLAGTVAFGLTRYDLSTYLPEAVLDMPASYSSVTSGWNILRWGQDGLALLASMENYSTNQTTTTVILLRGPFVAPQELGTDTAAALTSSSSASLTHGAGNTMLTLTGSNLLPGVAVTWNGNYRTTTIVDANHVTVAIPASDLAAAGTGSLVATNPGAPASNTLQITIN